MTIEPKIRLANKSEIPRLQELWLKFLDETSHIEMRTEKTKRVEKSFNSQNVFYLVATLEHEEIVAFADIEIIDKPSRYLYLDLLYVIPTLRKHGVAQKLLTKVEEFALDKNINTVQLDCAAAMIPMYEGLGYRLSCKMYKKVYKKIDLAWKKDGY